MQNGRRSTMALLVPGDFCDMHVAILGGMDHSIATLTACTMVEIGPEVIKELTKGYPRIARAMWRVRLVDEATLREWMVNISRRPAHHWVAHLSSELHCRLDAVGSARNGRFTLPLTQATISDILGLSTVHVNRVLQQLRQGD